MHLYKRPNLAMEKENVDEKHVSLPVENLAAGVYLVKLNNGTETKMVKLVKE